ncbi:AAA family ATPase [Ruminococcus sp.]|uniref:AAA family ATPase n=1 Tax=Ruminococcus sp. TaxID=41978 RepID=UPI003867FDF9
MNTIYQEINQQFDAAAERCEPSKPSAPVISPPERPLKVFRGSELAERCFERRDFWVESLLCSGLTVLAGAPKVGKSWLVLNMCLSIAKGKPFLGLNTRQCGVLYVALEDDERRLQRRILTITDECAEHLYLTNRCAEISEELEKELCFFLAEHRDVRVIVIDTLQKIRAGGRDMSYANDYDEISVLKNIADQLNIAIVLVHHTRKMSDSDYMNEISGTNGIAGSADTLMVLKKEKRASREAVLSCTGRDIEDRELKLRLSRESCIWQVISDSMEQERRELPGVIVKLIDLMEQKKLYDGYNTSFANWFTEETGEVITPNHLKRLMNLYRYELEDHGVSFDSFREKNRRRLKITYVPRNV